MLSESSNKFAISNQSPMIWGQTRTFDPSHATSVTSQNSAPTKLCAEDRSKLQAWHTQCYLSSKACYTVAVVSGLRHLPMAIL
ncbi:hypothetical protein A6X21_23275 [Planctopirus hydrillae]|uniref:Uncharacterized protein n=1 Tax=Planctopirus hydrillae TaxID=1841610 RepID=A0A1C3ECJ4_9PLAN|nr:hypothetical protein A6X21_23275 [Planctopirus hydrillae]